MSHCTHSQGRATKQQDGNQAVQAKQRRAAALLERAVRERRTQLKEAEGALQDAQQLKQHRAERLAALRCVMHLNGMVLYMNDFLCCCAGLEPT